jgi:uncharacterized protein (DUF433 family)
MNTVQPIQLIVINPDFKHGSPHLAGTGLRVIDIVVAHYFHHQSPEEIAINFAISLAETYAALAYYHLHKDEIDTEIREDLRRSEALEHKTGKQA